MSDPEDWNNITNEVSKTLYGRQKDEVVDLKDFTIKSVIGRGSFGKVFLV